MHEFIADTAEDVLAVTVSGKVTKADFDAIMDELDRLLAKFEKINVIVETKGIDGVELAALPGYTARALPLFGQLDRFGRVAVVADQPWVRFGTRLESMILPGIDYRVFEPNERDLALGWVEEMLPD